MEKFYLANIRQEDDFRCRSLASILSKWNREKDKARIYAAETSKPKRIL